MLLEPPVSTVYLQPGELLLSEAPALVSTVLGSCVSLTIHAPGHNVGAICHAMLPLGGDGGSFRYVDVCFHYLLHCFDRLDIPRSILKLKLFGGASVLNGSSGVKNLSVGEQNIRTALALLQQENLRLTNQDIGGTLGRKLIFYPHTGEVLLKRLGKPQTIGNSVGHGAASAGVALQ